MPKKKPIKVKKIVKEKPVVPEPTGPNPKEATEKRVTELRQLYDTLVREGITSISNLEAKIVQEEVLLSQFK